MLYSLEKQLRRAKLIKLLHKEDALVAKEEAEVVENFEEDVLVIWEPLVSKAGEFVVMSGKHEGSTIVTSTISSVWNNSETSDQDKLVLPKDFPCLKDIDFSVILPNDIVFATYNSIYVLR